VSENGYRRGSIFIYKMLDGVWILDAKVVAVDGADNDYFGTSVAIDGTTVVVSDAKGVAYIFSHDGDNWLQIYKLTPDKGVDSIAVHKNTIIIGASGNSDDTGTVYVYTSTDLATWELADKLVPNAIKSGDNYGHSVALNDNNILIGAYNKVIDGVQGGAAYLYTQHDGDWVINGKLSAGDDNFGISTSLSDKYIFIGAKNVNKYNKSCGVVYASELCSGTKSNCPLSDFKETSNSICNPKNTIAFKNTKSVNCEKICVKNNDCVSYQVGKGKCFLFGKTEKPIKDPKDLKDYRCFERKNNGKFKMKSKSMCHPGTTIAFFTKKSKLCKKKCNKFKDCTAFQVGNKKCFLLKGRGKTFDTKNQLKPFSCLIKNND